MSQERPISLNHRTLFRAAGALVGVKTVETFLRTTNHWRAKTAEAQVAAPLLSPERVTEMTEKMVAETRTLFREDDIGLRISNAYEGEDGMVYLAYQGAIVQQNPQLGLVLWNAMDELHGRNLDPILEVLYQIPLQQPFTDTTSDTNEIFKIRTDTWQIDKDIVNWAQGKRRSFEIGVPTSPQKSFGPFDVVRFQRYVVQKFWDDGAIKRVLTGDIVKNVGRTIDGKTIPGKKIIPDEALLTTPDPNSFPPLVANETRTVVNQSTRVVDTVPSNGVLLESRSSLNSNLEIVFNPALKSEIAKNIATDGLKHGFDTAYLIVLPTRHDAPPEAKMSYFGANNKILADVGMQIKDKTFIFYFAPSPGLDLNNPIDRKYVNQLTAAIFSLASIAGDLEPTSEDTRKTQGERQDQYQDLFSQMLQLSRSKT